ncbi:hypothetical protein C7I87_02365 [Mesorhizobium sp. SARCC-RB16n]|nr:hypothetical protein C7I87_02365 [Mesorhizobium sp. SARCC-RB16n]
MTKYQVEEIYGDTVVSSGTVVENDPMKAPKRRRDKGSRRGHYRIIGSGWSMKIKLPYTSTAWSDPTSG